MLKDKRFWAGFAIAYLLAVVLPPTKFLSMGRKTQG